MSDDDLERLERLINDKLDAQEHRLAARIDALHTELREAAADTWRRLDQVQATLSEHTRRLSNIEQAIIRIVPALRIEA